MKRITTVATAAGSAGLAAAAIGLGMLPALAASHPAVQARGQAPVPAQIVSQTGAGQYVSVVSCQGKEVPPPVHLREANTPLRLTGGTPSYAVTKAMAVPGRYKTVYTCTVVVKQAVPTHAGKGGGLNKCELGKGAAGKGGMGSCHRPVTLNTGFGGEAGPVSAHHPRSR